MAAGKWGLDGRCVVVVSVTRIPTGLKIDFQGNAESQSVTRETIDRVETRDWSFERRQGSAKSHYARHKSRRVEPVSLARSILAGVAGFACAMLVAPVHAQQRSVVCDILWQRAQTASRSVRPAHLNEFRKACQNDSRAQPPRATSSARRSFSSRLRSPQVRATTAGRCADRGQTLTRRRSTVTSPQWKPKRCLDRGRACNGQSGPDDSHSG